MRITGTIDIDGVLSAFSIEDDASYQQWGANTERLGQSVDAVRTMARSLWEEDLLDPEVPEPDDEEEDA